jgi:hypothetical protein
MRISYFGGKNVKKSLLRAEKNVSSGIGLYGTQNREFHADFRSEGIIQKKMHRKKDNPKKAVFLKIRLSPSPRKKKKCFFGSNFFGTFFRIMYSDLKSA